MPAAGHFLPRAVQERATIRELKAGAEGEAQQRIWERYFERLVALARGKLGKLRSYEDEEDVALSAMKSFFVRAANNQFPRLHDRSEQQRRFD